MLIPAALFAVCAVAYVFCLRPAISFSDLAEFATCPAFLAPGHFPGYPFPNQLYFLPHLPGPSPVYLAGLLNALFAAAAVAVLYLAWRELGAHAAVAAPVALAFAFTPAFWNWAAAGPEVYNVEVLTAALILWLAVAAVRRGDGRYYLAAAFIFGLALGNRTSFVLFGAWLLLSYFLLRNKRLAATALFFALGLSVYLMLAVRWGYFGDQDEWMSSSTFVKEATWVLDYRRYGGFPAGAPEERIIWKYVVSNLIFEVKYGALALALVGIGASLRNKRRASLTAGLVVTLALFLALYGNFAGAETQPYLQIPLALIFTLAALGANAVYSLGRRVRYGAAAVTLAAFTLPLYNVAHNYPLADHHHDRGRASFVVEANKTLAYEGAVVGEHCFFMPFAYYHFVLRARPDLSHHCIVSDDWARAVENFPREGLTPFGERGGPPLREKPAGRTYLINPFPGIDFRPEFRKRFVPGEFLGRELAALEPGGRFVAVAGDAAPLRIFPRLHVGGWQAFYWEEADAALPMVSKKGAGVLLAGEKTRAGLRIYAAKKWGAGRARLECPPELGLAPPWPVVVAFAGDAPYGLDALSLETAGRKYEIAASGIIYVPFASDWRAAGPPTYYYTDSYDVVDIYEGGGPNKREKSNT
ncbi:MAG: DUF2723 domain-containing protein [candidate division Zixibacteria bacterium]|nr:DUF2723 domain-containing protein [candidate division Zixibacteria bacterium]